MKPSVFKSCAGVLALTSALAGGAAGCATVKKKFTRKTDAAPARPVVYTEKEYVKPYTNEYYYTNNFNLWKVWQEEIVKSADGTNAKHLKRSLDEAISRLKEMQSYLEEPKRSELGAQIDQLERAAADLGQGSANPPGSQSKFVLDKTLRVIKANFYTDDVKPWIKKDEIVL